MNNDTNRLAQIIANAADKELGTRVLSDGQPRRQDKAAAKAIDSEYLVIRRDELPKTSIIMRGNSAHVEVEGSDAGTWPLNHQRNTSESNRQWGLEYIAASIAIQEWRDKEAERARQKRKMDLWEQMGAVPGEVDERLEKAIERIIELEKGAP
ncbi:hypothetical protein [Paenarthrobacter sp. CAP02]|uniref:hypothetical protein n=1 Tax=Paenarthrobacter sp. CAP02 TaxID=3158144 RepID=UPI0032DBD24B